MRSNSNSRKNRLKRGMAVSCPVAEFWSRLKGLDPMMEREVEVTVGVWMWNGSEGFRPLVSGLK